MLASVARTTKNPSMFKLPLGFTALCGSLPLAMTGEAKPFASDPHETIVHGALTQRGPVGDSQCEIVAITNAPDETARFPLVVLSHGSPPDPRDRVKIGRFRKTTQIRTFVERGFAVIVPGRHDDGAEGGSYAASTYSCGNPDYDQACAQAAKDILAPIRFADTLPFVDPTRVVLVGQSAGYIKLRTQKPSWSWSHRSATTHTACHMPTSPFRSGCIISMSSWSHRSGNERQTTCETLRRRWPTEAA